MLLAVNPTAHLSASVRGGIRGASREGPGGGVLFRQPQSFLAWRCRARHLHVGTCDQPTPGVGGLRAWHTQFAHAYRIERAPSVGGLLRWEHCRDSARASPLGHRSDLATDGHSSGGPAPCAAALLVDVSTWGGSCPPARRRQFSASRSTICSDALPGRQQHPSCRACRFYPPTFDRRSASARQPPQHGRIHPTSGSGDSCRERGGSLAIPAHWLGRGLLARVASAGPRKRVLHHHDPSCDCSGVRRSVGWGARDPEVLFGTRSHHRWVCSSWVSRSLVWSHRDPRLCPPCCWLLCRF